MHFLPPRHRILGHNSVLWVHSPLRLPLLLFSSCFVSILLLQPAEFDLGRLMHLIFSYPSRFCVVCCCLTRCFCCVGGLAASSSSIQPPSHLFGGLCGCSEDAEEGIDKCITKEALQRTRVHEEEVETREEEHGQHSSAWHGGSEQQQASCGPRLYEFESSSRNSSSGL